MGVTRRDVIELAIGALLVVVAATAHFAHATPVLAFHAVDAGIVDAWAAESAASLAFLVGTRQTHRLGRCDAEACDAYFLDVTKNTSRRFCSLACQNRAKSAAYRQKRRVKLS